MVLLGVVLLALGAILLVAEAHLPSAGVLGLGGVGALVVGALLALSGTGGGWPLAVAVAAVVGALAAGALFLLAPHAAATRRRRVRSGREGMLGHVGVLRSVGPPGRVFVDGSLWNAQPADPEREQLRAGDRIVVEGVNGLTLSVRRAEEWEVPE